MSIAAIISSSRFCNPSPSTRDTSQQYTCWMAAAVQVAGRGARHLSINHPRGSRGRKGKGGGRRGERDFQAINLDNTSHHTQTVVYHFYLSLHIPAAKSGGLGEITGLENVLMLFSFVKWKYDNTHKNITIVLRYSCFNFLFFCT